MNDIPKFLLIFKILYIYILKFAILIVMINNKAREKGKNTQNIKNMGRKGDLN